MALTSKSIEFNIQGKVIAAEQWGEQGTPIIALHGWLDNCKSFAVLAPHLENVQLLALDLAGHGHSEHRSADASYHIWDDVREILMIADEMGWDRFSLLGHSRGAIIASLIAGSMGERIDQLLLIEGLLPLTAPANQAPEQLSKYLGKLLDFKGVSKGKADLQEMVDVRLRAGFGMTEPAARLVVERNVESIDGYYYWRTDPRLTMPSPMMLSPEQAVAFVKNINCPSLLLVGDEAMALSESKWNSVLDGKTNFSVKILPGKHHLHMEDAAGEIAQLINEFLPG